jgi:hypothetical protein
MISFPFKEEFENIKGVIRICISKNRQHNGHKIKYKRTNNDLQYITNKTKDQVTQTPLKTGGVKIQNNLVISLWNVEISRKETLCFLGKTILLGFLLASRQTNNLF